MVSSNTNVNEFQGIHYLNVLKLKTLAVLVFFSSTLIPSLSVHAESKATIKYSALSSQIFSYNNNEYPIKLLQGFRLELLTDKLNKPRLFSFDKNGILFIGSKSAEVYRLEPPYTQSEIFTSLDNYPHSIAFLNNNIYIAQTGGIYRARYTSGIKKIKSTDFTRIANIPGGSGHNSRTIATGPDERLYISLGIQGNCSNQFMGNQYATEDRRGGIYVLNESTKPASLDIFASGLRNPVGFDWHPVTKIMYTSNNGPDHHGFENPPEYFSKIEAGSFHGMPWFQFDGKKLFRDECIRSKSPFNKRQVKIPVVTFPARNAPMGVSFFSDDSIFTDYIKSAVVALRGSWATRPDWNYKKAAASRRHPKLVIVNFDDKHKAINVDDLLTGFQLENGNRWARPVGVGSGPDGALYFTSDSGINGLFRISKQ